MQRILVGAVALFTLSLSAGCTLAMIEQLRKPGTATAPAAADFPEAEQVLRGAAIKAPRSGTIVRAYILDETWGANPESTARRVELSLYYRTTGGALVKDEKGGQDQVCFAYGCVLDQLATPSGYGAAVVECNDALARKVTCDSVAALPQGVVL